MSRHFCTLETCLYPLLHLHINFLISDQSRRNDAANAYMLHALSIAHVVSVGECALIPPSADSSTGKARYTCPNKNAQFPTQWLEGQNGGVAFTLRNAKAASRSSILRGCAMMGSIRSSPNLPRFVNGWTEHASRVAKCSCIVA